MNIYVFLSTFLCSWYDTTCVVDGKSLPNWTLSFLSTNYCLTRFTCILFLLLVYICFSINLFCVPHVFLLSASQQLPCIKIFFPFFQITYIKYQTSTPVTRRSLYILLVIPMQKFWWGKFHALYIQFLLKGSEVTGQGSHQATEQFMISSEEEKKRIFFTYPFNHSVGRLKIKKSQQTIKIHVYPVTCQVFEYQIHSHNQICRLKLILPWTIYMWEHLKPHKT